MHTSETNANIDALMEDVYSLFREQINYEGVSYLEHNIIERIQYASAVVQSEKVTPPGGWDIFGR